MSDRMIGRERELAQLEIAIGPGGDGLRLAMLSGPSGQGKTTLMRRACAAARERGFRIAAIDGRAGTLSTPFAPFMEAMPEFQVLLSVLAGDATIDVEHAGIGLVNLLAELTSDQPLLLVFDDVQALDESSIALLPYLIGISERADLSVLFIEQTDAVGVPDSYRSFIDGLLARRVVSRLELGPLADPYVRELVADRLELEDVASVPDEIIQRADGNPWFAKELADSFRRGDTEIPTNIAAAATARLYRLDETGQDIVFACALCTEGAHVGWLESLAGQKPRQFVRTFEAILASGLVREDGDIISIAHPLMQQALCEELSTAMRRAIHTELAEVVAIVPLAQVVSMRARAFHLAAAGRTDDAVEAYLAAAHAHEIVGQLHEALLDLENALSAETKTDARISLLRRIGYLAAQLGSGRVLQTWEELAQIAAASGDDESYAYALFQQYWSCNDGTAHTRLERAAALGADSYGWSARAAATLARMDGDYLRAIRYDELAIQRAEEINDDLLATLAREKRATSLADLGQLEQAVDALQDAIDHAIRHRLHGWAITSWGALAETYAELLQTDRAIAEAEALSRYVSDLGLERMCPSVDAWLASAYLTCGRVRDAVAAADRAARLDSTWGGDRNSALVHLMRYESLVEAGDFARIADAGSAALAATLHLGYESWTFEVKRVDVQVMLRAGEIASAQELTRSLTIEEPLALGRLALVLARNATLDGSQELLGLALDRASILDRTVPLGALMRDEIDATATAMSSEHGSGLFEIADAWRSAGRHLDAARCEVSGAQVEIRAGRGKDVVDRLKRLRAAVAEHGADWDADHVAALLRQLGTRSRAKSRTTNVGPLTKRELEIARLVASGLKNSEVAGTLFLAEKTVAAHLSNIYGKVEVRSRVQLGAWIREHDPEFETVVATAS